MPHTIPPAFRDWLSRQLNLYNFSQSEASTRAGLNKNAISDLFTGKVKRVSFNTILALSNLFGTPLLEVLKYAGYIESSVTNDDLALVEIMELVKLLSPEDRQALLFFVRWRVRQQPPAK